MSDKNLPALIGPIPMIFPRSQAEIALREIGIRGVEAVPAMIAMRMGLDSMPPELATIAEALADPESSLVISFSVTRDAEDGGRARVAGFDIEIAG